MSSEQPIIISAPPPPKSSGFLWLIAIVALAASVGLIVKRGTASGPASLTEEGGVEGNVVSIPNSTVAGGARMKITTEPAGASVLINGKLLGGTPLTVDGLAQGVYGVRIERSGCAPVKRSVTVKDDLVTLNEKLEPLPTGSLNVSVKPEGSEVLLDGELVGYTPLQIAAVTAGPHELLVRKTNFDPYAARIDVIPGEPLTYADFELKDRIFAMLESQMKAEPQRLTHYIDLGHYLFVNNKLDESVEIWAQGMEMAGGPVDFDGPGYTGVKNMTRAEMDLEMRLRREDDSRFNKELEKHRNWPGRNTKQFRDKLELARETMNSRNIGSWEWADRAAQMNIRNRNFEKTVRIYNDHIKAVAPDAPSVHKAYTSLVKVHLIARDQILAQKYFEDFVGKFAKDGAALRYFGAEIYPYQDRFTTKGRVQVLEMAEKAFRLALPLTTEPVEKAQCQFDLGAVLNYLGKSAEAVPLLESAVEGTPDEALKEERSLRLADAYRRAGHLENAWNMYSRLSNSERTAIRESAKTGLVYVSSDRAKAKKE